VCVSVLVEVRQVVSMCVCVCVRRTKWFCVCVSVQERGNAADSE